MRPVSQFVRHQIFRFELIVADEVELHGQTAVGVDRAEEGDAGILVGPAGRVDGTGYRSPERVSLVGSPKHAGGGLDFKAGIAVLLELRAHDEVDAVGDDGNVILHKRIDQIRVAGTGRYGIPVTNRELIGLKAQAAAPDQLVAVRQLEVMLEVGVERIERIVSEKVRPSDGVVIQLD